MRAFRRRQRLQRVKEYQDKQARTPADTPLYVTSTQSEPLDIVRRFPQSSEISDRTSERNFEEILDTIPPDIWHGPAFDPFSSTVLYTHHYAPQLFSHCTLVSDL
jgi:hypothetical protein